MRIHRRHAIPEPRRTTYRYAFLAAAAYNIVYGLTMMTLPHASMQLAEMPIDKVGPVGVMFWKGIGLSVALFAICYYYCWRDPERYAPIIFAAMVGKIFGPLGFLWAWLGEQIVPGRAGIGIIFSDLIWWPAFVPFVYETVIQKRYEPR